VTFQPQPTRQDMIEALRACLSLAHTLSNLAPHVPALRALLHGLEHGDRFVGGQRD
jgi:hypothetical protein